MNITTLSNNIDPYLKVIVSPESAGEINDGQAGILVPSSGVEIRFEAVDSYGNSTVVNPAELIVNGTSMTTDGSFRRVYNFNQNISIADALNEYSSSGLLGVSLAHDNIYCINSGHSIVSRFTIKYGTLAKNIVITALSISDPNKVFQGYMLLASRNGGDFHYREIYPTFELNTEFEIALFKLYSDGSFEQCDYEDITYLVHDNYMFTPTNHSYQVVNGILHLSLHEYGSSYSVDSSIIYITAYRNDEQIGYINLCFG